MGESRRVIGLELASKLETIDGTVAAARERLSRLAR
jgi:hypothetical protein